MAKFSLSSAISYVWPMGGVLSGSLLIAWATEVLSFFLSRGMAFAVLALLQVLPEFAVEAVITFEAALDPSRLQYVTANFTGANRLIVGLFLPLVFFIAAARSRRAGQRLQFVELPRESSIEVVALVIATIYSFKLVVRGQVTLVDAVILGGMYAAYLFMTYRLPPEKEEAEELPLIPRTIRGLPIIRQKWTIFALFALGGGLLFVSVHPFYENTIHLGEAFQIPPYFLLQWLAPFLSEFPEFITILYWGRTGRAQLGLTNAISSKVNQWTLLIAMIPIVYGYGTWRAQGFRGVLQFDASQQLEILLTAAQGIFAAACFINLRFHRWEAWTLLGLWAFQLLDPVIDPLIAGNLPFTIPTFFGTGHYVRELTTLAYLVLTPFVLFMPNNRFAALHGFKQVWHEHFLRRPPEGIHSPMDPKA